MSSHTFLERLDALIESKHLLKHPFYQAWTEGTVTKAQLQYYAGQYFQHVNAFPRYISSVHSNCDDLTVRQELLENLVEEEKGEMNHPELWMRFADATGISREEVQSMQPNRQTMALISTFFACTRSDNVASGITALYAYEAQIPEIAATKIEGLKKFYGIEGEQALSFFTVHQTADVVHRQVGRDILERLIVTEADAEVALAAAHATLDSLWVLLDGVIEHRPVARAS